MTRKRDPDPPSLGVPAFVVFGVVAVLAIAIKAIIGTLL